MKSAILAIVLFLGMTSVASASTICPRETALAHKVNALLDNDEEPRTTVRAWVDAEIQQSEISVEAARQCRAEIAQVYRKPNLSTKEKSDLRRSDRALLVLIGYMSGQVF